MMKYKILRIHWATWIKLRGLVPGIDGEIMDDYLKRIVRGLEDGKNN